MAGWEVLVVIAAWSSCPVLGQQTPCKSDAIIIDDDDHILPDTYNGKYQKDADEMWLLSRESGVWGLVFRQLSIEPSFDCRFDYLEIRELLHGKEIKSPTRYCGQKVPPPYVSHGNVVEIQFVSDSMWEMDGFWIQAVHAPNADVLKEKMENLSPDRKKKQVLALSSKEEPDDPEDTDQINGSLFYILIGASAAGLVVFSIMLLYFIIAIRKRRHTVKIRESSLYYVNQRAGSMTSSVSSRTGSSSSGSVNIVLKSGRKYSKDKTARKPGNTAPKATRSPAELSHLNNLYVLNKQNAAV